MKSKVYAFSLLLIFSLIAKLVFFGSYKLHGTSMEPSLEKGDWILVSKIAYQFKLPFIGDLSYYAFPKRGDMIAFDAPKGSESEGKSLIKRVVALAGDEVVFKSGVLYINRLKVGPDYKNRKDLKILLPNLNNEKKVSITRKDPLVFALSKNAVIVPENHVYVLGDSWDDSLDSRKLGPIPMELVLGRAGLSLLNLSKLQVQYKTF